MHRQLHRPSGNISHPALMLQHRSGVLRIRAEKAKSQILSSKVIQTKEEYCPLIIAKCNYFCKECINVPRKKELKIPEPRLLTSGNYFIQLRINGKSISITENDYNVCKARARAIKAGIIEEKNKM